MIQALGDIREVIQNATLEDKARVYDQLGLRLTYAPNTKTIRAEMNLDPNGRGVMVSVRVGHGPYMHDLLAHCGRDFP
jgi:site-specific DNA recombinase